MANAERMEAQLKALSLISEQGEEGTTRLSYTPEYRKGADYIKKLMEEAGLTVREAAAGLVWGLLPGTDPDAPKLISGSHLDTVRCSGFYDGQAGIICALEAARMIKESGKPLKGDFEVVAIPMEEGARFPNLTGSKLAAGVLKEADLDLVKDTEGTTLREAMLSYGLTGKLDGVDRSKEKVKAFIELHMEQGTLLEDEGIDLGVVDGIFGCYWKTITVRGEVSHPSTPMAKRKDAGLAACRIVSDLSEHVAKNYVGKATVTCGKMDFHPGEINAIPSRAVFSVDFRSGDKKNFDELDAYLAEKIAQVEKDYRVKVEQEVFSNTPPTPNTPAIMNALTTGAKNLGLKSVVLPSGAGHDTMIFAKIWPTGMIFIPSHEGYTHSPREYTDPRNLANGADLIAEAIRILDAQ